jgi:hypothetical protein
MTKRFFFATAAIALMMVSCSQNEEVVTNVTTSNAITLDPTTAATRASIANLNTLRGDNNGFGVYAENGDPAIGWHVDINGANNHFFDNTKGKWNFKSPVLWPDMVTAPEMYPMTFIAYYPTNSKVISDVIDDFSDVKLEITVPPSSSDQEDVLAGESTALSKPSSATLNMGFHHVLSKVHFTVANIYKGNPTTTQKAFVLAVGFDQLHSTNVYDIRNKSWGTVTDDLDAYNYYNTFEPDVVPHGEKLFQGATLSTPGKFYTTTPTFEESFMMLLPQDPKTWDTTTDPDNVTAPGFDEAYVRMYYRVEETVPYNPNFIGFQKASDHPGYEYSELKDKGYDGPLYVKVGYSYDSKWISGRGYNYIIPIPGSTGGRLLDNVYYDEDGNETDLEVEDNDVPEVIIPDDDYIHLSPIVTDWDDDNADIIEQ